MWKIIETEPSLAQKNMELDENFLKNIEKQGRPILHFYGWSQKSLTYGHFVNPSKFLNLNEVKKRGISLAKRPTGGGIIFHVSDLAFSVVVPAGSPHFSTNILKNYKYVNSAVKEAVAAFLKKEGLFLDLLEKEKPSLDTSCSSFCMAKPTKYDVMLGGKKIAGAAQRQAKGGFLHQGSISIALPDATFLSSVLLKGTKVLKAMDQNTFCLLQSPYSESDLEMVRNALKKQLTTYLTQQGMY